MKFPSLAATLRLLKPFTKTDSTVNSSQIPELSESVGKFELLTELQQQLTIVSLIKHDMVETLEMILHSKYDVNFLISGQTPLHFAIKGQSLNMIRVLIKHNADLEFVDIYKETALNCAVRTANIEILKYLLEQGAKVNTHASDNTTPLEFAIRNGDTASVNVLRKYGAHLGNSYLIKNL